MFEDVGVSLMFERVDFFLGLGMVLRRDKLMFEVVGFIVFEI